MQPQHNQKSFQQQIRVIRLDGNRRLLARLVCGTQLLESANQTDSPHRQENYQGTDSRHTGNAVVICRIMVHPLTTLKQASAHGISQALSPANFGSSSHVRTGLETRCLDTLRSQTSDLPLLAGLQRSSLASARQMQTCGGAAIAALMHRARASITWRSYNVL